MPRVLSSLKKHMRTSGSAMHAKPTNNTMRHVPACKYQLAFKNCTSRRQVHQQFDLVASTRTAAPGTHRPFIAEEREEHDAEQRPAATADVEHYVFPGVQCRAAGMRTK